MEEYKPNRDPNRLIINHFENAIDCVNQGDCDPEIIDQQVKKCTQIIEQYIDKEVNIFGYKSPLDSGVHSELASLYVNLISANNNQNRDAEHAKPELYHNGNASFIWDCDQFICDYDKNRLANITEFVNSVVNLGSSVVYCVDKLNNQERRAIDEEFDRISNKIIEIGRGARNLNNYDELFSDKQLFVEACVAVMKILKFEDNMAAAYVRCVDYVFDNKD